MPVTDDSVIDHFSTAMISPALGTSPDVIAKAVRMHTVATVEDLKRPCDQDLEAALRIVPLIAAGAARGATGIGAPFGAVVSGVMRGVLKGTGEIGGDPVWVAREAAEALVREAGREDADLDLTVVGVVSGAAETTGSQVTAVTEAAIRGLLDGAVQIGSGTGNAVKQALLDTAYLPRDPITRVLGPRS